MVRRLGGAVKRRHAACARSRLAAAVALALGLLACPGEPPRGTRLVLVTLDTLRYDAFAGGAQPSAMPRLLARSRAGVRFSRFYAATPVTQPSHATMFTELQPWEHGVTRNGEDLADEFTTVAEALREAGFTTHAVVASFPVSGRFGFSQGFDAYVEEFSEVLSRREVWEGRENEGGAFFSSAETVTERALASLDASVGTKQFFWFHYFDPHAPYGSSRGSDLAKWHFFRRMEAGESGERLLEEIRARYRADVEYLDRALDRLLARLDRDADRFETHVVLVSDHGESLGDGGSLGHGFQLGDVEIRVPALILSPRLEAGVRHGLAGSIDVAPTLLSLAGLPLWERGGRDLTRAGAGRRELLGMRGTFRSPLAERRVDGRSYPLPRFLFYAVDAAGEVRRGNADQLAGDLPDADAQRLRALFAGIESRLARVPETSVDPETLRALEALGYAP
jgi:arylsulfatase A-like enzyme